MVRTLRAHETHSNRESNARRNPEYRTIDNKIAWLRRQLKQTQGPAREALIKELMERERQQRIMPYYAKGDRHPSQIGYARDAADCVSMVQGKQGEAQAIKDEVGKKLQEMGLALSEEKTKLPHWRYKVNFLGYQLHGTPTGKGTRIRPILSIPREHVQKIKEALRVVGGYHHIPAVDAITQMSAMFRGWCTYYRDATAPQATCSDLSNSPWWRYAHDVARKHRRSMAQIIRQERQAKRRGTGTRNGRSSTTFRVFIERKTVTLDLFPPRTGQIRARASTGQWTVDIQPVMPMNGQSGRSFATRTAALERAHGTWERGGENPVTHVHHTVPLRGKTCLARVMSASAQRYTAQALCQECHLEVHGGSYTPRRGKGQVG